MMPVYRIRIKGGEYMQRRYRRFFVILENENLGNDKKDQQPKGHAKFEIKNEKGMLTLNCQNLKAFKEKNVRYRWYLLNTKNDEPVVVDIGPMEVDPNGKGELTWEFIADNVKASKSEIDQFNIITLLVEAIGDKKILEAPLVGYIEKDKEKIDWKGMLEKRLYGEFTLESKKANMRNTEVKNQELIPNFNLKEIKQEEPVKEEKITEVPKETTPLKEKSTYSFEEFSDEFKKSIKEENIITPAKPIMIDQEKPQQPEARPQTQQETNDIGHIPAVEYNFNTVASEAKPVIDANQKDTVQTYIESTLKMFPQVYPFEENLRNYQWWQLPYNYQTMYRAYMPFIAYIEGMRYPNYYFPYQYPSEYQRLIYMHQHYIFGICYDQDKKTKHYVYGIPGRRVITDQPYGGTTGFVYWNSCNKQSKDDSAAGYWLMHVDPVSGKITTPMEATKL